MFPRDRILPKSLCRAQRAQKPCSRAAFLLVSGPAWKEGEALPKADPASHLCYSLPTCPHCCLSLCTHKNTPRDCLLLCKQQLCRPFCSSSLHEAAGCLGRAARVLINTLFHVGFPFPGAPSRGHRCHRQCQHCSNCRSSS